MDGLKKRFGEQISFQRLNILDASSKALMDAYAVSTAPEVFLLDREGQIAYHWDEDGSEAEMTQGCEAVLR